jgi:hypothetical protein
MTTRGVINSNFYQIVFVDADGNPTSIDPAYISGGNAANANYANFAGNAFSVNVGNVVGIGNIATVNLTGNGGQVLLGNGNWGVGGNPTTIENGNSNVTVPSANGYVYINANAGTNQQWIFETTGNLILPSGGTLGNPYGDSGNQSQLQAGPNGYAGINNYDKNQYVVVNDNGAFIGANYPGNTRQWEFYKDGNTTFPANGSITLGNLATANYFSGDGSLLSNLDLGNVANSNYANYAGNAFSVDGANVVGQVGNALIAGTVYTNAQPNITSLGNITGLISTGNITAPYFLGNVVGNISGNIVVPGLQWDILFNDGGNAGASDNFKFDANANVLTVVGNIDATYYIGNGGGLTNINGANVSNVANANYANFAGTAYSVAGANVSGIVANANYANIAGNAYSVDVANVVGIGNIATLNLDGNSGNILYGNGVFSAVPDVANSNSANFANYANFSGNAYSVAGGNVVGEVANANYSNYSNVAYNVNVANVIGIGNIATVNLDGNSGNILYGNGVFSSTPTVSNVANSNYANYAGNAFAVDGGNVNGQVGNSLIAGTVYTNSQPNITSIGTLTTLTVSGNINSNNIIAGNIISANSFFATTQTTATTPGGSLSLTYLSPQNQRFTGSSIFDVVLPDPTTLTIGAVWYLNNDSSNNIIVKNHAGTTLYTVLPGANTKFIFTGGTSWDYHSYLPNTMSASSTTANLANLVIANYFSGTLTTAAQPNITSVGTLTSLAVTGNISSGNANLGNLVTANFFSGNGSLLTGLSAGTPGGSNTQVQFNDGNTFGGNSNLTFNKTSGNLTVGGNITLGANIVDSGNNWSLKYTPVVGFTPSNLVLSGGGGNFYSGGGIGSVGGFTGTSFILNNIQGTQANFTTTITTIFEGSSVVLSNSGNINSHAILQFYGYSGFTEVGPGKLYYDGTANSFVISSANSINIAPTGNTLLGSNSKVKITGGTNGQVLSTDGAGNLSWATSSGGGGGTDFVPSFLLGGM